MAGQLLRHASSAFPDTERVSKRFAKSSAVRSSPLTSHSRTTVLEVSGVQWSSQQAVAEIVLSRRPGVTAVDVNAVAQTASVTYDPGVTSVAELAGWVRDCGYHCAGRSVPRHVCDPMTEPNPTVTSDSRTPLSS